MRPQSAEPEHARSLNAPRSAPLHGLPLLIARGTWASVVVLAFVLFILAIPAEFEYLQTTCAECDGPRLTLDGAQKLERLGLSMGFYAMYTLALEVGFATASFAVAAVIFWRRSDDAMALLGALAVVAWGITFPNTTVALAESYPAWEPPVALLGFVGLIAFTLFFYVFPDGRFAPRWVRWLALILISLAAPSYFFPDSSASVGTWPAVLQIPFYLVWMGSLLAVQVYRYRSVSGPAERQQTRWVVFGFVSAIVGFLAVVSVYPFLSQPGPLAYLAGNSSIYLSMLMIPLSIAVAILRYRLFDIDFVINRALVYAGLTACVVTIYVLIVGYLDTLLQSGGNLVISLVATGVVAMLFQPPRDRVQRFVNRLMYGERDDPYAALSRLGQRLEATLAPGAVLPAAVRTVSEVLKSPYVAVEVERNGAYESVAATGEPANDALRMPLVYGGEKVGRLVLVPRTGEEDFSDADWRLLDDLARQIGVAVHATRLTEEAMRLSADLQKSRERLVGAREEERRRLRRDLHDGLGPQLASLTMKAEAARDLLDSAPDRSDALLEEITDQAQEAVTDVRRLVYGLRPPALDDLGLLGALRAQATHGDHDGLRVTVEAPEALPVLPAAVEVAAYRIVQEALTNAARHARARHCTARITPDEQAGVLCLEVTDDGRSIPAERPAGVGLSSMRERAGELGGTCKVEALPSGGTSVLAVLPLAGGVSQDKGIVPGSRGA